MSEYAIVLGLITIAVVLTISALSSQIIALFTSTLTAIG